MKQGSSDIINSGPVAKNKTQTDFVPQETGGVRSGSTNETPTSPTEKKIKQHTKDGGPRERKGRHRRIGFRYDGPLHADGRRGRIILARPCSVGTKVRETGLRPAT